MSRRSAAFLPVVVGAALMQLLTACGGGGAGGDDASSVPATLHDGAIELSQATVPAGRVRLMVENQGTMTHEIEVFAGDDTEIPVSNNVADTSGMELVDEVEDIAPGLTPTLDLDLEPGDYVVICNLPGHYEMGMVTKLTVTG